MEQAPQPQPQQPQYGYPPPAQPGNGLAIASMVLGIISVPLICLWYISLPCAILAIVFGFIGRANAARMGGAGMGFATAGLVLGFVAIGLVVLAIAGALAFLGIYEEEIREGMREGLREIERQRQQQGVPGGVILPLALLW